ncbi:MAG TPA: hypothetical protein VL588_03965, partial [Bdellovibrionota bacterium]|nr:hypothetical protein [Bdellovibrionota bacterium]
SCTKTSPRPFENRMLCAMNLLPSSDDKDRLISNAGDGDRKIPEFWVTAWLWLKHGGRDGIMQMTPCKPIFYPVPEQIPLKPKCTTWPYMNPQHSDNGTRLVALKGPGEPVRHIMYYYSEDAAKVATRVCPMDAAGFPMPPDSCFVEVNGEVGTGSASDEIDAVLVEQFKRALAHGEDPEVMKGIARELCRDVKDLDKVFPDLNQVPETPKEDPKKKNAKATEKGPKTATPPPAEDPPKEVELEPNASTAPPPEELPKVIEFNPPKPVPAEVED